jgi:tetratricopeptide (TPR) repeat protein
MARNSMFARIVVTGLWCVLASPASEWSVTESRRLESLAEEALALSTTVRDHRDELYRSRMLIAMARHQDTYAEELGARWLAELDAIKPMSNEERSALDIARVENVQVYGNPARILPALIESERAMPRDYVASLRLAQTELMAKRYDDAIAAIDRGLARSPGALGRSWLLQMKAEALKQEGQQRDAHRALQLALVAARQIPNPASRKRNIDNIKKELSLEKSQN